MKILFIDTASKLGKVHFSDGETIRTEENFGEKTHSIELLPMINRALCGLPPEEIDIIAVTNGPGSYTGLRIALSTAKTLAWALKKPLAAVNTLDYLAWSNAAGKETGDRVVSLIDARNRQAFYGIYDINENGEPVRLEVGADGIENICETAERDGKKVYYCGDGANNILGLSTSLGSGEAAVALVLKTYAARSCDSDFSPEKTEAYYMKDVHVTIKNDVKNS